jgi:hypothetical protein
MVTITNGCPCLDLPGDRRSNRPLPEACGAPRWGPRGRHPPGVHDPASFDGGTTGPALGKCFVTRSIDSGFCSSLDQASTRWLSDPHDRLRADSSRSGQATGDAERRIRLERGSEFGRDLLRHDDVDCRRPPNLRGMLAFSFKGDGENGNRRSFVVALIPEDLRKNGCKLNFVRVSPRCLQLPQGARCSIRQAPSTPRPRQHWRNLLDLHPTARAHRSCPRQRPSPARRSE